MGFDEADSSKITNDPYPVPKELWFLCDLITSLGLHQENLFLQPGLRSEIGQLREWLDTGTYKNENFISEIILGQNQDIFIWSVDEIASLSLIYLKVL